METILYFAAILFVTFAGGTLACLLDWLLLRFAFRLMRPAGVGQPALVRGASQTRAPRMNSNNSVSAAQR